MSAIHDELYVWYLTCYSQLIASILSVDYIIFLINEPHNEKTYFTFYANNKDADQPMHPRSIIISFVVNSLDSTIPTFAVSKISRL